MPDSGYVVQENLWVTGRAIRPGQQGEIVGTCLTNFVTPIIRYRQNDLAVFSIKLCDCGKTSPILKTLAGRKNSSFKHPDGTDIPSGRILDWTYNLVLTLRLGICEFQITQRTLTLIAVQLVINENYQPEVDNHRVINSFKQTFGQIFEVRIKLVRHIKRTKSGKHNAIQSLV